MEDTVVEEIKNNPIKYSNLMSENLNSNIWLNEEFKHPFVEKKLTIPDFELVCDEKIDSKELSFINSKILFEKLKKLPPYVLSDEKFWAWINFDKGYVLSQMLIPINNKPSRLKNHYFFGSGSTRRGMFFGVLSRLYFRAQLTYDNSAGNPYELTRYVNENPMRFRNLTWRTYSNNSDFVKRILRIQFKLELLYKDKISTKTFEHLAKYISQLGSTTYVELLSDEDLENLLIKRVKKLMEENESL
jgi:hypothetical protein